MDNVRRPEDRTPYLQQCQQEQEELQQISMGHAPTQQSPHDTAHHHCKRSVATCQQPSVQSMKEYAAAVSFCSTCVKTSSAIGERTRVSQAPQKRHALYNGRSTTGRSRSRRHPSRSGANSIHKDQSDCGLSDFLCAPCTPERCLAVWLLRGNNYLLIVRRSSCFRCLCALFSTGPVAASFR